MRSQNLDDARTSRVPPAGDRRRNPNAARLLSVGKAKDAGFESGIQSAMERLLVSFNFLFRIENPPATASGTAR